jgi:hypothetical protein
VPPRGRAGGRGRSPPLRPRAATRRGPSGAARRRVAAGRGRARSAAGVLRGSARTGAGASGAPRRAPRRSAAAVRRARAALLEPPTKRQRCQRADGELVEEERPARLDQLSESAAGIVERGRVVERDDGDRRRERARGSSRSANATARTSSLSGSSTSQPTARSARARRPAPAPTSSTRAGGSGRFARITPLRSVNAIWRFSLVPGQCAGRLPALRGDSGGGGGGRLRPCGGAWCVNVESGQHRDGQAITPCRWQSLQLRWLTLWTSSVVR